uniref:Uncharacterized protein n=1 Tax=Globodera rostochiensis TaxID=31243 RepID=A0A914IE02_GLORO
MANKFVLVPQEIYRGLTTVSDTGDINLDTVRHDLERARGERANPSAKNVRYNQQLRRYLHMRNERESKPTKVELSKGLSVLVKRDGEEEGEVVDTPQPPALGQRRISQNQLNTPQPPALRQRRIVQTQQKMRPEPPNRQQNRKRKTTKFRVDDTSEIKRNFNNANSLEIPSPHREAIQRYQRRISKKRALRQTARTAPQHDLVTEAAAAPIIDDDDEDDDYLFENGNILPAPPILLVTTRRGNWSPKEKFHQINKKEDLQQKEDM